jgi:hypothetical protein
MIQAKQVESNLYKPSSRESSLYEYVSFNIRAHLFFVSSLSKPIQTEFTGSWTHLTPII